MSCESCVYSEPDPEGSPIMECRRKPPQLVFVLGEGWKQAWPLVRKQDWCGEAAYREPMT